jgi:DNA-binding Xre family transcriptional regulator
LWSCSQIFIIRLEIAPKALTKMLFVCIIRTDVLMNAKLSTSGRITVLLGKKQAETGQRTSPRKLAEQAGVPKDFIYRLDAGQARHIDLEALAKLCAALNCQPQDILVWESQHVKPI